MMPEREKGFLFPNTARANWRCGCGGDDGGEWLASPDVSILTSAPNLPESTMLEVLLIQEIAALKWPKTFTFALLEHPVKGDEEEWKVLEEALVWFITKKTSRIIYSHTTLNASDLV